MVLVAVLLPILFACAGLAMDLGSIYSYKSNLRNAVDSAALAGGFSIYAK
ncbi:pilus assembly protein TadG-related protein [Dialister hominis]